MWDREFHGVDVSGLAKVFDIVKKIKRDKEFQQELAEATQELAEARRLAKEHDETVSQEVLQTYTGCVQQLNNLNQGIFHPSTVKESDFEFQCKFSKTAIVSDTRVINDGVGDDKDHALYIYTKSEIFFVGLFMKVG